METTQNYNYQKAIERNIGLCSEFEQVLLNHSSVGIAGVGAVGGNNLITLARMGIGNFKIADLDIFEEVNLQRQAGAFISSLNKSKVDVMAHMVKDINPLCKIETYSEGVTEGNIDDFLKNIDIVLDCIDAFQITPRRMLYQKAKARGVYVIFSAPKEYGATLQIFDPRGMSFDEYFGIRSNMTKAEQLAVFLMGLSPTLLPQNKFFESKIDFEKEKAPALASTVALSTGIVTTAVLKILLNRGKPLCIPHSFNVDSYHWQFKHTKRKPIKFRWLQKLLIKVCFKKFPSLNSLHLKEVSQTS